MDSLLACSTHTFPEQVKALHATNNFLEADTALAVTCVG